MEDILNVYHRPYNADRPQVGMDEQPTQLIKETRIPLPALPGNAPRYDYDYERHGPAVHFLFTEPLTGWRKVNVTARRTKVDWAYESKELLEVDDPDAEEVLLVCDNLNTHPIAALYEAFEPAEAPRPASRLELHYTPKHGSWLNIAEMELSILSQQWLDRRIPDLETLRGQTKAWEQARNETQKTGDWRFTTEDARIKLRRLYP